VLSEPVKITSSFVTLFHSEHAEFRELSRANGNVEQPIGAVLIQPGEAGPTFSKTDLFFSTIRCRHRGRAPLRNVFNVLRARRARGLRLRVLASGRPTLESLETRALLSAGPLGLNLDVLDFV